MATVGASKIVSVEEWIAFLQEHNYSKDIRVYNDKSWSEAYRKIILDTQLPEDDFIIIPDPTTITDFYCIFKKKTKNTYPVVISLKYDNTQSTLQYWNMFTTGKRNRDDLYPQPPIKKPTPNNTVTIDELRAILVAIPRMTGGGRRKTRRRSRTT